MQLKDYYRKIRRNYLFYGFIPLIFSVEILIYVFITKPEQSLKGFLGAACALLFLITAVLMIIQSVTAVKFRKKMMKLNKEQLHAVEDAARNIPNMGRLLLTKEVLTDYGMFVKHVILIRDIKAVRLIQNEYTTQGRYWIHVRNNFLEIQLKSGKKVSVLCPSLYDGNEGEAVYQILNGLVEEGNYLKENLAVFREYAVNAPYNGILCCVLVGILLCINGLSGTVKYGLIHGEDNIKLLLLHIGYDPLFFIGSVLLVFTVTLLTLLIRRKSGKIDGADWFSNYFYGILILGCCLLFYDGMKDWNSQAAKSARNDYHYYLENQFETINTDSFMIRGGADPAEWMNLDAKKAVREYGLTLNCLIIDREVYILVNYDGEMKGKSNYEISYLKNTRLITRIRTNGKAAGEAIEE